MAKATQLRIRVHAPISDLWTLESWSGQRDLPNTHSAHGLAVLCKSLSGGMLGPRGDDLS